MSGNLPKSLEEGRNRTLAELAALRQPGMAMGYREQLERPQDYAGMSFDERFARVVERAIDLRRANIAARLLKKSGLGSLAFDESSIRYDAARGWDREFIRNVLDCGWIFGAAAPGVLVTGPTGTGKTVFLRLLVRSACDRCIPALYIGLPQLCERISDAAKAGRTAELRREINSFRLLALDDFNKPPEDAAVREQLLTLLKEREGLCNTAVASVLPHDSLHEGLGEAPWSDQIMDIIDNNVIAREFRGDSMRELRKAGASP